MVVQGESNRCDYNNNQWSYMVKLKNMLFDVNVVGIWLCRLSVEYMCFGCLFGGYHNRYVCI